MIWWIVIPGVAVAALSYAYWEHRKQSRRLVNLFMPLAAKFDGEVKAATILALPQLHFDRKSRRYKIGAMASGGPLVSGSASRPGFNGPFTFVDLELPFDTGQELRIHRNDALDRGINRALDSVTAGHQPISGEDVFDDAFRIKSHDPEFTHRVLAPELRQKLLASSQQRLEVALTGARISVHIDGYVRSAIELDEMIDIANLFAENCEAS